MCAESCCGTKVNSRFEVETGHHPRAADDDDWVDTMLGFLNIATLQLDADRH